MSIYKKATEDYFASLSNRNSGQVSALSSWWNRGFPTKIHLQREAFCVVDVRFYGCRFTRSRKFHAERGAPRCKALQTAKWSL